MVIAFAICQIIVLYVLMFVENYDYFVLGYFLVCVFGENRRDYYVWFVLHVC
jgi:hypothetical protein